MKGLQKIILICIILFKSQAAFAIKKIILKDTVVVKTILPTKNQEQKVFNQVDLEFAKKTENNDVGLWQRFWDWLTDLIFGKVDENSKQNLQLVFIWALALIGLAIIVWLFTNTQFTSFLKGSTKSSSFNFTDVDEDISTIDFSARIKKAINEDDYRLAVRWLYLKQLYLLNQKNKIIYEPFKTNIDYAIELTNSAHQKKFQAISRIYDYVWYGKYDITLNKFNSIDLEFKKFETELDV